jgi:hypothetical protein
MRLLLSLHSIAGDKTRSQQNLLTRDKTKNENFSQNTIFKNQNSLKIKTQERRPRKGRLGGDRAAFATPSWVPSKEKNAKEKNIKEQN